MTAQRLVNGKTTSLSALFKGKSGALDREKLNHRGFHPQ